jgi:hypothetical protein
VLKRTSLSNVLPVMTIDRTALILTLVLLSGISVAHLSDGLPITLLTTAAVNVFGFFYLVVNYLFPRAK